LSFVGFREDPFDFLFPAVSRSGPSNPIRSVLMVFPVESQHFPTDNYRHLFPVFSPCRPDSGPHLSSFCLRSFSSRLGFGRPGLSPRCSGRSCLTSQLLWLFDCHFSSSIPPILTAMVVPPFVLGAFLPKTPPGTFCHLTCAPFFPFLVKGFYS